MSSEPDTEQFHARIGRLELEKDFLKKLGQTRSVAELRKLVVPSTEPRAAFRASTAAASTIRLLRRARRIWKLCGFWTSAAINQVWEVDIIYIALGKTLYT